MEQSVGVRVPLYPRTECCLLVACGHVMFLRRLHLDVTINTVSAVQHEADIHVSAEELKPHFDRAYENFRPKAELRGFRKGKVPLPMIKKIYGEAIENDALDTIANELYRKAMEEREIRPIGTPAMIDMDYRRNEYFRFRIKYEVKPAIALQQYKGIAVDKPVRTVDDREIDAEIHHLRRLNSTTVDALEATDAEHVVTANVQELDESGAPLIGKKSTNSRFYLADEALAPEIKAALASSKVGGVYRAAVESRHDDHSHTHAFEFTVTALQKVELPPEDEAFVKKVTGDKVALVEEFRKNIRADLERYWEDQGNARVNDAIANELVRLHEFPVPDSIVEAFLDSFVEDIRSRSRDRQLPAGFKEGDFRTESRAQAVWQARWLLLKERIAEEEKITVTDDDLLALAEREAARLTIDKNRLMEYYRSTGSAAERILTDKVMAFLRSHAVVTEQALKEPAV
jgi:trigger factor